MTIFHLTLFLLLIIGPVALAWFKGVDSRKNGKIKRPEKVEQVFERQAYPDKAVLL